MTKDRQRLVSLNTPQGIHDNYAVFGRDCVQCHRLSRPINSDYVLPDQWSRYIKWIVYKPGSNIG